MEQGRPAAATIFALASGRGRAGVAVMRMSGPAAGAALCALTGRALPAARRATLAHLGDPVSGEQIDTGIVLWFPAPSSVTGADVAEFHVHGGRAVVDALAAALASLAEVRLAEPGEFTRRAFENGKLDLTAAEAVADLVEAETGAQRRQALRQLGGELARLYEGWRERLAGALAHLEAAIDFPEDDLPENLARTTAPALGRLVEQIGAHLDDGRRGERLRDGLSIAIVGAPNAGKSSLLNALARRDAAIVSERAGTTRDVVEVHLNLGEFPVILADTAGLREVADEIESEGVRRALARADQADLKLAVFDATLWPALDAHTRGLIDDDTLVVLNKIDRVMVAEALVDGRPCLPVSALLGCGVPALVAALAGEAARRLEGGGGPTLTRARHRAALEECRQALLRAVGATAAELAAEDVRLASRALGRITGRVDVEELLDIIFRDFCIGK